MEGSFLYGLLQLDVAQEVLDYYGSPGVSFANVRQFLAAQYSVNANTIHWIIKKR